MQIAFVRGPDTVFSLSCFPGIPATSILSKLFGLALLAYSDSDFIVLIILLCFVYFLFLYCCVFVFVVPSGVINNDNARRSSNGVATQIAINH